MLTKNQLKHHQSIRFANDSNMELKKPIYYFVLALSLWATVNFLFLTLSIIGGALWTLLAMLLLGAGIFYLRKVLIDFSFESSYFKFVFWLFFVYELVLILRGCRVNYQEFKELILSEFLFWQYLIPLFVLFDKRLSSFAYLINAIYFMGIAFLVISLLRPSLIITRTTAETFIHPLAFGCGFLLLNARYISKNKKMVAFAAMMIGFLCFTYLARRNGVLSYGNFIVAALFLNIKSLSAEKFFKLIPVFSAIILLGMFGTGYLPDSLSSRLKERMGENSRSDVFYNLFKDMQGHEVFGKGMNGKYYSPSGGELPDEGVVFDTVEYRAAIENGWLQLFLNGGIVYMVLFALLTVPAVLLGFFKSKNQFIQSCSLVIFFWLIDMAVFGLPRLTFEYVLVWICVGACYKKSLRQKTNEEIYEAFNKTEIE